MNLLSEIVLNGNDVVKSVIEIVVLGIIFWLLWWLLQKVKLPEPFNKIAEVVITLVAVLVAINILLGIAGHPLIKWQ